MIKIINEDVRSDRRLEKVLKNYFSEMYEKGKGSSNTAGGEEYFEDLDEFNDPYLVAYSPEEEISFNLEEGGLEEIFEELGLDDEKIDDDETFDKILNKAISVGSEYVSPGRLLKVFKKHLDLSGISEINPEKSTEINGAPLSLIYTGGGGPTYFVYDYSRVNDYFQ